jgi:L-fuconolactonase
MAREIVDAHQHVWDPARASYDWLGPELAPIDRAIGFDELRPSLDRAGVTSTVLVQSADNAEDTRLMLEVAAANLEIAAVVAFVPLDRPADAERDLAELRQNPLVVGVRNLIHNHPDPDWLLRPDVDAGLSVLEQAGVTFDLVAVLSRHLELVPLLSERHPGLRIVIDHLGKPPIGLDASEPWWQLIADAATNPMVYAKVSGLYSATTDPGAWTPDVVRPFFLHACDKFGPDRLMYGGDWPISLLAGGYERVWEGLSELFDELDPDDRDRLLSGTATDFYGLKPRAQIAGLGE